MKKIPSKKHSNLLLPYVIDMTIGSVAYACIIFLNDKVGKLVFVFAVFKGIYGHAFYTLNQVFAFPFLELCSFKLLQLCSISSQLKNRLMLPFTISH